MEPMAAVPERLAPADNAGAAKTFLRAVMLGHTLAKIRQDWRNLRPFGARGQQLESASVGAI